LQKAVNEGTGSPIRSQYGIHVPLAGKTGTTQDYTDAWFASYNPSLVVVSRVGASTPSIRFNSSRHGTGSALALPLVALTIKKGITYTKWNTILNKPFPSWDNEAFPDCPEFKEVSGFEEFIKKFRREKVPDTLRIKKKRPFFKRLFGTH
jgi:penicillin-binding protein 1A